MKWRFSRKGTTLDDDTANIVGQEENDEPKLLDVSDCIETVGWGRYHWKVVVAMGMMSFADCSEIWIISLITYDLMCEWGLSTIEEALIPGLVFFSMAIGSFVSGQYSDQYGRLRIMLIIYYVFSISAVGSAFAWSYYSFLIIRCIAGFCIGANYSISICYSAEMVPIGKRSFNLLLLDLCWMAGGTYICLCAFFVMEYHNGWRYLILCAAAPCIFTVIVLHFCDESVRYLLITDRKQDALAVLNKMAKENGVAPIEGELTSNIVMCGNIVEVYLKPYTRTTFVLGILFAAVMWIFYGFLYFLPDMMSYGYCHLSEMFETTYVNSEGCKVYTKAEYLFLMFINLTYLPAYISSPIMAEYWGRKPTIWISYWGSLILTTTLLYCISDVMIYIELLLVINFYGAAIATMWLYIPECYPTYIRSSASGAQNGMGKIGAACGTFLTEYLDSIDIRYSIYVTVAVLIVACIASLFLQLETRGMSLKDNRTNETENEQIQYDRYSNYGANTTPS